MNRKTATIGANKIKEKTLPMNAATHRRKRRSRMKTSLKQRSAMISRSTKCLKLFVDLLIMAALCLWDVTVFATSLFCIGIKWRVTRPTDLHRPTQTGLTVTELECAILVVVALDPQFRGWEFKLGYNVR